MKNPDYYRQRAAEVRKMAAETSNPKIKAHLTEIAEDYEGLAKEAEEIPSSETAVISAQRKKWLAAQLCRIAEQDSPATEWRAIASTFRKLAEHIDAEPVRAETKKSRRDRRK